MLEVVIQRNFVADFIRENFTGTNSDIAFLCYPLGDLGVTYTVHLWLVGKRVVDRTGVQDRKKVTKGLYFRYLWRSRHWSDVYKNLCSGWCSRRNHVCQVLKWNFNGYDFTGGQIFHVPIYFLNGRYNSAALLRCLWCNLVRECKMFVKDKAKISSRVGGVKWRVAKASWFLSQMSKNSVVDELKVRRLAVI